MTVEREPAQTEDQPQIVITDNMRLWGKIAATALTDPAYTGMSGTLRALSAYADANNAIELTPEEQTTLRHLITNNRVAELGDASGSPEAGEKPDGQTEYAGLFSKLRQWDMARKLAVIRMSGRPIINPKLREVASSLIQLLAVDEANRLVPLTFDETRILIILLNAGQVTTEEEVSRAETPEES